jgi:type VI secretion system protein ImpC
MPLPTTSLVDGSPSLLNDVLAQARLTPEDEGYTITRQGIAALVAQIQDSGPLRETVNKTRVDHLIVELDRQLGLLMDEILHHPQLQALESSWRALKLLVDRTDFRENISIQLLHATKEELLDDFEYATDLTQSGFYQHLYASGYGQFGGEPIAAVIGDYAFSPAAPDIKLLQYMSAVGAMAHAPFITSAAPSFFGIDSYSELAAIKDLKSVFEGPAHARWRSLRESEDARYLGLTAPRFLVRLPYDPGNNPIKGFHYQEQTSAAHQHYLWGNTAFLLATALTDSFARYRWCPNIIGPQSGGAIHDLPVHLFEAMGQLQAKIPTEVLITDRREYELAEEGFIALTMRKESDNAAFFSANSVQKPKLFPNTEQGRQAATNYRLGTQLPYLFVINRLAHYLKVLQREQLGAWKERQDLERELNGWVRQYVADQENPPAEVRCRRPLRSARVQVLEVEGETGWYQVALSVRPHFKYMGASFELSLVGRLDKE